MRIPRSAATLWIFVTLATAACGPGSAGEADPSDAPPASAPGEPPRAEDQVVAPGSPVAPARDTSAGAVQRDTAPRDTLLRDSVRIGPIFEIPAIADTARVP